MLTTLVYCATQDDDDDDWFPEDPHEAFKEMRERRVFDVSDMYTIADAWGWTWERDLKKRPPQKWSQEWEVELAVKIMDKACSGAHKTCSHFFDWHPVVMLVIYFSFK